MKFEHLQHASKIWYAGFGKEGQSSKKFLGNKFPNIPFEILENISTPLSAHNSQEFFIVSPGIDRNIWLKDIPQDQQTSNTELFFDNISEKNRKKTIGITGSKGKSSTTKFLCEALKISGKKVTIGGNFGIPLLDIFDEMDDLDYAVSELSSFQLEFLKTSPYYAIFLNIFSDHLDRHGGKNGYFSSKKNLWNGKNKPAKYLIIPEKHAHSNILEELFLEFPLSKETTLHPAKIFPENCFPSDSVCNAQHFRENFGSVLVLFELLNIKNSWDFLEKTAQNFEGLPHRTEFFMEWNGHKFYDDSIATNPETSAASVAFFGKNLGAIVLGGKPGGEDAKDFSVVFESFEKNHIPFLWLPKSECRDAILKTVQKYNFPEKHIIQGENFSELLEKGMSKIPKNSGITLSPGAKSFDSFSNYQERGKSWKNAVKIFTEKNS